MQRQLKTLLLILFAVLFLSQSATAEDYPIPDHGNLHLTIPTGWKVSSRPIKQPPSLSLQFLPEKGDAFDIQVTTVWLEAAALAKTTPESIRTDTQNSGRRLMTQAVETVLTVQELRGAQTVGYYYALTDRAPAPGEFQFIIQGTTRNEQVLTVFTILVRASKTSPEVDQALKMLAAAVYSAK